MYEISFRQGGPRLVALVSARKKPTVDPVAGGRQHSLHHGPCAHRRARQAAFARRVQLSSVSMRPGPMPTVANNSSNCLSFAAFLGRSDADSGLARAGIPFRKILI